MSLQLWLWSLTEKESPNATAAPQSGEQHVQIAEVWGERPRSGALEEEMTLIDYLL